MIEITAKKKNKATGEEMAAQVTYDFGSNVQEAIEKFGEEVVFTNFRSAAKITAQAAMRRMLEQGKDQDTIASVMATWRPGVSLERTVDPVASIKSKWASLSEEDRKALMKELKKG